MDVQGGPTDKDLGAIQDSSGVMTTRVSMARGEHGTIRTDARPGSLFSLPFALDFISTPFMYV